MRICKFICLCAVLGAMRAPANDWPNWRGPTHNGISTETGWLDHRAAEGPPILWKAKVGSGFSSFAIANGRLYTAGNQTNTDTVFCLDAVSGKPVWTHSYEAALGDTYFEGGATGTPTVDDNRVYTLSRWGDVFCFEAASGKIVWSKNVHKETNIRIPTWGFGGSALVHGNEIMLNVGEAGLALEKTTGKILWQSANKESGYSTPLPVQIDGKSLAILGSGRAYIGVDPDTGHEVWRARWQTQYGVNASDPIVDAGRIFISTGYGKGASLFKLRLDGREPEAVWTSKVMRNQFNSSVLLNGFLYGIDGDAGEKAALKCVEFATGTMKWEEKGVGSGALMAADGKLIVLTDYGELMIAPASPDGFKPSARTQVLGGKCWTTPILANGKIYCRNAAGNLVCLDVAKSGAN